VYLRERFQLDATQLGNAVLALLIALNLGGVIYGPLDRWTGRRKMVIAGGVAANRLLRTELQSALPDFNIEYAPPSLCTDNAAMIAALAYYQSHSEQPVSPLGFEIYPSWSM
jgi:tRNA A37 threonylcarbamoyltransferase TsaD